MVALFGRYEYERELGRGATGRVLAVRDLAEGGAQRAIKVVSAAHAGLLVWEFQRLCRLSHPRVARVRELLRIDEPVHAPFRLAAPALLLVEDRAPGVPLAQCAAEADPHKRDAFAVRVALSVAEGLSAIHRVGLVHGDVKPDNLLVDEQGQATLVDLGFCAPPGARQEVRGTPRYMAPELFSGTRSAAADVYALGAALFDWLAGESEGHSALRADGLVHVRELDALRGQVAPGLCEVIAALLEPDLTRRPSDGAAVHQLLVPVAQALSVLSRKDPALLGPGPSGDAEAARARSLPFLGHAAALAELEAQLSTQGCALVIGPRGAGRSRLVREALRRLCLQHIASGRAPPTLLRTLESVSELGEVPAVLWLEPAASDRARELASALRVRALRRTGLALVLECDTPLAQPQPELACITLGALDEASFRELLSRLIEPRPLTPALLSAAEQCSQKLAGRLCNVLAEACAAQRDPGDPRSLRASDELDASSLSEAGFVLGSFSAWLGGALLPALCVHAPLGEAEREAGFAELWARGLVRESAGGLSLLPAAASALRALSLERRAGLLAALPEEQAPASGFSLFARGQLTAAERAFAAQAARLRTAGEVEEARLLLREALGLVSSEPLRVAWADAERARAFYPEALAVLSAATSPEARLLEADVLRLRGERAAAQAMVKALGEHAQGPLRERALALDARIAFDAGDFAGAEQSAAALAEAAEPEARVRALEVRFLVALATGLPPREQADALMREASALAEPRFLARALLLRAQLSARAGELGAALVDAQRALEQAERAGEAHEAASAALNLGLLRAEAGELGLALSTLSSAALRLARIDRPSDLSRVLFNLSALSLLIGDHARAQALLDAADEPARKTADPAVRAFLAMTRAELWLKRGQVERAQGELTRALSELPGELAPIRAVLAARAAQAELLHGDLARAAALVVEARASASAGDVSVELEVTVAEIRERIAAGAPAQAEQISQRALPLIAGRAPIAERLRFLFAAVDAARAAERESEARERTLLCRAMLEALLGTLSPEARAKLRERPEYARVLAAALPLSQAASARGGDRWRRLVASTRRLFATTQRRRLAQEVVELALELVHAERAFLVACADDGSLPLLAQAQLGPSNAHEPGFSRSVVERVWSERRPLLTLEASRDLRLHAAQSIHALSVRSVLAVPVSGLGEPCVLYLDDRLRADAFDADDLALLEDLAALAREALRAAHARKLESQRADRAEQTASDLTRALSLRGEAEHEQALVGVSAPLQEVTASARRVARSDVSLLITGESGTGKELLARYVHRESTRAALPFVAESCAALPDTLLESALFGHVRGAFTGAERARRGMFENADKGTLFLDEVGEMSPALQAKLLRVLQEGEFRPLGSERTRKVDVRVIAATRANLSARVREGTFREDLYYRLAVVTLELPALAARRGDIPLLVRHFLNKHQTKGQKVSVTPAAMRAFVERDYPGNVRQLENEVRRALALCEGGRIEATDLPASGSRPPAAEGTAELSLHAQLDALSARLVDEALARASGNVTQAAELLGISRFGLQKMLKRRKHS